MTTKNFGGWFEIATADMERAIQFYEAVFNCKMTRLPMGPIDMALFPANTAGEGCAGTLVYFPDFYKPSMEGTLLYLISPSDNLAIELDRVEANGGKILVPKTQISPEHGFMAIFTDTEGNRLAMHSIN